MEYVLVTTKLFSNECLIDGMHCIRNIYCGNLDRGGVNC